MILEYEKPAVEILCLMSEQTLATGRAEREARDNANGDNVGVTPNVSFNEGVEDGW